MATAAKRAKKNYTTWSNMERHILLAYRIKKDVWFTGKNANSTEGWRKIAVDLTENFGGEKDAAACKAQWNAMIKKYKSFFKYHSSEGTGEEAVLAESKDWEFFDEIHTYASSKDNYHPPLLIDSRDGILSNNNRSGSCTSINDETSLSSPSTENDYSMSSTSTSRSTPKSRGNSLEDHIRKRDKKLNKKLSSLLCIFGQMVQTHDPNIDATALMLSSILIIIIFQTRLLFTSADELSNFYYCRKSSLWHSKQ